MGRRLLNRRPDRLGILYLGSLPFVVALILYVVLAASVGDPSHASMPSLPDITASAWRLAAVNTGRGPPLWVDTVASLWRMVGGLGLAAGGGLLCGVAIGLVPHARAIMAPALAALAILPALTLLPILSSSVWTPEGVAIAVIVIGVGPRLARDMARRIGRLPGEYLIKAQTLGASTWQLALRLVIPQLLPSLLTGVRRSLPLAWLLLIAVEALAPSVGVGLGHRLFAAGRAGALDVVLPYIAWIAILACAFDQALAWWQRRGFAWRRPTMVTQ